MGHKADVRSNFLGLVAGIIRFYKLDRYDWQANTHSESKAVDKEDEGDEHLCSDPDILATLDE